MQFRHLLLALALVAAGNAHAQSAAADAALPRPSEFYFDADAQATKPVLAVRETGDAAVAKLVKLIDRDPRAKDQAVTWYAVAVRTEPAQFRDTARHAQLLPDWTDSERATLAEVQAAWARNPPAWR